MSSLAHSSPDGASIPTCDDEALRIALEVPETGYLWTTPHKFTPRLVSEVFGDGRRLMYLTTINNRPAYWIIRVDSGWDIGMGSYGEPDLPYGAPCFADVIDDVLTSIEGQFGEWDPESAYYNACQEAADNGKRKPREDRFWGRSWREFPSIDSRDGCMWGTICWPGTDSSLRPLPDALGASASEAQAGYEGEAGVNQK